MKKPKVQQTKLMRIITMPIRTLAKARDLYVRSMNNHASKLCYGGSGWGVTEPLPRSFSMNSTRPLDKDDAKDLIRVASTITMGSNTSHLSHDHHALRLGSVPRCTSSVGFGMAKIEEDKPCEFGDNYVGFVGVNFGDDHGKCVDTGASKKDKFWAFPRSRSCATKKTSLVF